MNSIINCLGHDIVVVYDESFVFCMRRIRQDNLLCQLVSRAI